MLQLRNDDRVPPRVEPTSIGSLGILIPLGLLLAGCASEARGESEAPPIPPKPSVEAAAAPIEDKPKAIAPTASDKGAAQPCPAGSVLIAGGMLKTLERARDVAVAGFCLDSDEVTVAEYRACVERGDCARDCKGQDGCVSVPKRSDWGDPSADWIASKFCNGTRVGRDDHPVNCVSLAEARSYCAASGQRLPSGDEWEWAARGGDNALATPWGTPVAKDEICWGKPRKRDGSCAAGTHPRDRTAHGVEALGGGVSEWVTAPHRAGGDKSPVRFAYGASWYAIDDGYARAALGGFQMPATRTETIGFRCAADPAPTHTK